MTTESILEDEKWNSITEQSILLHDGLKYVADLISPPESAPKLSSFDLIDSDQFRFDSTSLTKLSESLKTSCSVEHSPYHLFFDFRQRSIATLWQVQQRCLHKLSNAPSKYGESGPTSSESTQTVSFTSHISLLLILPLLQSQARTNPSLKASCISLLLNCLKECCPNSLKGEPLACITGLEELLYSWIETEPCKETLSTENEANKEDIIGALTALACGRLSLKGFIQLVLILLRHKSSLQDISICKVLHNSLHYILSGHYAKPSLLKTSLFTELWPCSPFPDLPVNLTVEEKCPSIACNGKYLFVTNASGKGLAKIGTGKYGSFRSFIYNINLYTEEGWVAWNDGSLLFRPQQFDSGDNKALCHLLDSSSLQVKETVYLDKGAASLSLPQEDAKVQTVQFTSDGVHLYWIFTSQRQTASQPSQELTDFKLYVWEFYLKINESSDAMQKCMAYPVKKPVMITVLQSQVKDGPNQYNHTANKQLSQPNIDLGLTQERLIQTPMFVSSNMLVLISPHSPNSDPKVIALRSKKNPVNCCFSLDDGQFICRESVIDADDSTWESFFIPRLGICCDPSNGVLWSFGHGKVHQWIDSGYPCLNQVLQTLAIHGDIIDLSTRSDSISVDQVISFVTIHVSILSQVLAAQLNTSPAISPTLDSTCIQLIYEVLQLAIVGKHHSTIVCLLQSLQLFLKFNSNSPDPQLVKDLRSLVWMLVCSKSTHTQIQTEACKVFVCGLKTFYSESKEQSALLMVLLSEKDSNGVVLLRDMLLDDMSRQLVAVKPLHGLPNRLANDAVNKLIKTCVTESSNNIALCGSLNDVEFFKFIATQPDTSAALTYISNLVLKTWKDLMLSVDSTVDETITHITESISKNVESIMLANKMFEACQKLFEEAFEVLTSLQERDKDMLSLRLNGLEKVIQATPIGQVLVFLVTILTHAKFCSLPLATGLLSRVTSTTIAATKTAKLFCHLKESSNQTEQDSPACQSVMSSLPDLSLWTRSNKVETIHPIRDDYKLTKTVTFKGAKCVYIKFDPRCATQYEYDKVLVYAGTSTSGKKVGEYGGNSYGYGSKGVISLGWPTDAIRVEGESVTFNFQVKSTRERNTPDRAVWGFACKVSLKEDDEDSEVNIPVLVDVALGLLYLNYRLLGVLYNGPATVSEEHTCSHLLNSQLLQRCVWEKTKATPLSDTEACGITITVTPEPDKASPAFPQPIPKLSQELIKQLRDISGALAPTLRPSIRQALRPQEIEQVTLSAVIRHLDLSDMIHGLELLQVVDFESSKYLKLCDTLRDVFRRLDGILRQLQAMAEAELRWSQEVEDIRHGLLQPSAAFFNEYHLQEVKSKDLELLCNLKEIDFDPMEQEQVVGKLIELLDGDSKSDAISYDPDDLLSRMPKTRVMRHSVMECGELLCRVTIKNDCKKDAPGRSISQGTFSNSTDKDNTKVESEDKAVLFYRSLSAPSHLHRSLSLQEGAKDLRRLQRWRTAVQKKNNLLSQTSHPEGGRRSMDYGTIVDDIFAFIGSDSDNAVSCASFLAAARIRNERGLSRVQALLHMHDLVTMCSEMPGSTPNLLHTVASILSQGPRVEDLKCGGLVETVSEEFSNVVQSLLQQAASDPVEYSNTIITMSLCPFSWQDEICVIRSGIVVLLDRLCVLGCSKTGESHNLSSMAWASFQVLLNQLVQWETDQDYKAGAIEWSGQAYQVSSLITNYLNTVLQDSNRNSSRTKDALQHILKLLQSIAQSKMGEAILQQPCMVSTLLAVLLHRQSPPKLVLAVLRLCHVALPLMTETTCQEITFPTDCDNYLSNKGGSYDNSDSSLGNSGSSSGNSDTSLDNDDISTRNGENSASNGINSPSDSENIGDISQIKGSGCLGTSNSFLGNDSVKPDVKVAKLLLTKLGEFVLPFTPVEKSERGESEDDSSNSMNQYSLFVHKRVNQPAHEVVHKVMSSMGQQLKQGPGLREEIFRAVQLDRELTQNNQMLVLTDSMNACLNQATQLAEIGLVTSIAPPNHNTGTSEDERDLKTSEEVCQRRNRKLASESCRPFVSGQVALTMASEVILLLQSLLSSNGTSKKLWSNTIRMVLLDALNLVPSLVQNIAENVDHVIQYLQSDNSDDSIPDNHVELMTTSRQVMSALCVLGGFKQNIYTGCKAKITGEDMKPSNCEVTVINDLQSTATVTMNDGNPQSTVDVPLARLELANKRVVLADRLGLVETTLEALMEILKTRDVTLPCPNAIHDGNTLLVRTCTARVLAEMKSRASMVLACQMKTPTFNSFFNDHPSRPMQAIQVLANDCDPGQRQSVLESHCQELRKLFKDLIKPSDVSFKGRIKDIILDVTKDYPPVQGIMVSEGNKVAHLVCEGASVPSLPRGSYLHANVSIPVKAPSFYWEVEVLSLGNIEDNYASSGSSLSIGLVPAITHSPEQWSTPICSCLLHDNGIAVHYKRGGFTAWETFSTGLVLKPNHVVGCGYTRSEDNRGTVYFTHNGQLLPGCLNDVSAGLWPVVHLQRKNVKVRVNFGNRPFKYAKGSEIREAADLVTDSMEEIRNLLQELPFTGGDHDSEEDSKPATPPTSTTADQAAVNEQSTSKNIPEPFALPTAVEFREYDPSLSVSYLLTSSCDVMADIGPSTHLKEDDHQTDIGLDHKTTNPTDLLVKAWEDKVFPVIRRRFRNEADRRSGLEQIRGALQAGLMDIAIATLEDLYEDSGGIPNSLTMPRLEDVKDDANKITITTIKQNMNVVISTSLLDSSMAAYIVPDMRKTAGLNGLVVAVDKAQKLVEVQTYNREEGHLTRFWYPVDVLEKPSSGLARSSSFLAMQSRDTSQVDAQHLLLTSERQLTRLNCRNVLVEAMSKRTESEQDGLGFVKTLSCQLLKDPYCNGSTTPWSLPTVPYPRECLSLSHCLPSAIFYSDPKTITSEIHRLIDTACHLGEDDMIKLTNALCKGLKEPTISHREFHVNHNAFEEEVYFNDAAVTIVTCRLNPAVHNGWLNNKNPLVTALCYYGGPILNKSGRKARYKAVQYPDVDQDDNHDKYPSRILPTNRLSVRCEKHAVEGPILDLHGFSAEVLLGLVFAECFVDRLSTDLKSGRHLKETAVKASLRAAVYTVLETVSKFILKIDLPPCVKEIGFHLVAQLLRLNHKLEAMTNSTPPSQTYTAQLSLILARLSPLKTELQKLLDKEVSVSNVAALEFVLKGNFENNKFSSYLQALFGVVLAMGEVTPLMRDHSGSRRNRQGSITEVELLESQVEPVLSPSSFTFASFDFKLSDSETTPSASPLSSPSAVVPRTPPAHARPRRRGSLRKRKRAHVQEIFSPTDSMSWFNAVISTTLLLRYMVDNDPVGTAAVHDSLLAVVNAKTSSVLQRLLVVTNISQTMDRQHVIDALKKACKPCGGIFEERAYIPEIHEDVEQQDKQPKSEEHNWEAYSQLLPSAKANKPRRICGHAVIELRNSSQVDLARQNIVANKSLRESTTEQDNIVGVAKVNSDLLMSGTNELEAFAVFDKFLVDKLFQSGELRKDALCAFTEIFNSCSTALSQQELGRDTPPSLTPRHEMPPYQTSSTEMLVEDHQGKSQNDEVSKTVLRSDSSILDQTEKQPTSEKNLLVQDTAALSVAQQSYPELITKTKSENISPALPQSEFLPEEHICTLSSSNLLGAFFQSFCHSKQTIHNVVDQVLQDFGVPVGDEQHCCLTIDGFIEWVKSKDTDSVRSVWKAIFVCGYDLQFQRCTFIFCKDILEDHSNWSISKDKTLVNFVDHKCRALSTSPSQLMPDELHVTTADLASERFAALQDLSLLSIRSRFAFLKSVNDTVERLVLSMADLRVSNTHSLSTGAILKTASGLLFYDTKMAFLNRTLDQSSQRSCPNSSPELSLDPLQTLEADKLSSSSQFSQAAGYLASVSSAGLRVKVASGGDPNFPLRVQLRGEQVLGSGGSFRHFVWLMARELQSQHINLLIPCPSTAANKNKGMLILKPGPMSYNEERLLVFFGQLLGIALRSDIPLAVDLMPVFWKSLLGLPLDSKSDLFETDILTYNYIRRFSEVESKEEFSTLCYEADLCPYRFVYTSLNGQEVELCPDGANKSVTWDNHREYLELIRELRLRELGCESRMAAIRCGLYSVIPLHDLCVLQPSDLQKRTCGIPNVDLDFLKAHTTYVAGIKETDQHIEFFWNALESFTQDQLCKFVKFACNQERLPSTCTCQKGISTADVHVPPYPMKIGPPDGSGRSDARYIRVETCMFMVKLPQYSTQEITNQKLLYAINCREDPLTDI